MGKVFVGETRGVVMSLFRGDGEKFDFCGSGNSEKNRCGAVSRGIKWGNGGKTEGEEGGV